jgi:predicted RNA binding protein YcfA (HicA-like mRNA interferase family)
MSPKIPRVDCQQLIQILKHVGFEEQRQRGSHLHLYRVSDSRRITVPVHKGRIIPIGTLKAILRDADIDNETFFELVNRYS